MKRIFNCLPILALSVPVVALSQTPPERQAVKEQKATLLGTYAIVGGETEGKPIDPSQYKGAIVVFTKDSMLATDKDRKDFFAASFTLDTSAKPMKVTFTVSTPKDGGTVVGILENNGDTVRVCYPLPGGESPKEFKTKEKQHMFVLKRADK